jgi:cardiolipin synthase
VITLRPVTTQVHVPFSSPLSYCAQPEQVVHGNRVTVLRDGEEAFPAMLEAIDGARSAVRLETYIFASDATGRRFARALAGAAARGVDVALLHDSLGSWRASARVFDEMRAAGVKVLSFKPLAPWRRGWGWGRRDHRKQLSVDGRVGFTGGINVADEWACARDGGAGWRDTMIRISGPAVAQLDRLFRETWEREAARQGVALPLAPDPPGAARAGDDPVWVVGNREFSRRRAIRKAYRHAIARAERRVMVANSYFVPDPAILRSLRRARRRGVEVLLLLPGASDMRSVQWASRAVYGRLLAWGIEIWHWCDPVFHAKTAVVDGLWCTVGSYNLDTQSLRYNLEVTAVVPSPEVAGALERMFREDLARCERVDPATWKRRPFWWRLPEALFYLVRAWL